MKLLPFFVFSLCIFFVCNEVIFANKKYNRVRCRDLWCSYKARKDKKDLIKKANDLRGYKEPEKPREPLNVRLRYLYSMTNKNEQNLNSNSFYLIWNNFGIGQNNQIYKSTSGNNLYEVSNSSIDLSYTIGKDWSLTIGRGVIYSGKGEISFFDSNKVETDEVKGESSFGVIGFELGIIELLFGLRDDEIYYSEFQSILNEEKKLDLEYKLDLRQWFIGLGLSF